MVYTKLEDIKNVREIVIRKDEVILRPIGEKERVFKAEEVGSLDILSGIEPPLFTSPKEGTSVIFLNYGVCEVGQISDYYGTRKLIYCREKEE